MGKRALIGTVVALLLGFVPSITQATLLNLTKTTPDIQSGLISVNYNGNGNFTASGSDLTFDLDGVAPPDFNITGSKTFTINMIVDGAFNVLSGTVTMNGVIGAPVNASGVLLTGTITDFGFAAGNPNFEFKFNVGAGSLLASYYGGVGAKAGIILGSGTAFHGNFGSPYSNSIAGGSADSFPIPEPTSSLALAVVAMTGIVRRRGRRS